MSDRFFLYIDILGFKNLINSGFDIRAIYSRIDDLNVHHDNGFKCIVFSDTILVYAADGWENYRNQVIMWLIEFAQDLFFRLISIDVHIRAYVTRGDFEHYKLNNIESYYGKALVNCYEKAKAIKCTGVFLDAKIAHLNHIFQLTKFDDECFYVHVMHNLDQISWGYDEYPIKGEFIECTGMEWWIAYQLVYLHRTYKHGHEEGLEPKIRVKHQKAWEMLSTRHPGLTKKLVEVNFDFHQIVTLDWTEPLARIGTENGAFG